MTTACRIVALCQEIGRPAQLRRALETAPPRPPILLAADSLNSPRADLDARVAEADVLILSHVLDDALVPRALELIHTVARPDAAVVGIQSLRPVLLATRMGALRLGAVSGRSPNPALPGPIARMLAADDLTPHLGELVRRLPTLLRLVPRRKADLRTFLTALLAWREPTPGNLRDLLVLLADRYGPEPGSHAGTYGPPTLQPDVGLWHPDTGIVTDPRRIPSIGRSTVGLLLARGPLLAGDHRAQATIVRGLERQGLSVLPAFSESFDFREPIDRYFRPARIEALISATGFPLVGGHNQLNRDASAECLRSLDVPYLTPPSLLTQSLTAWERSRMGLTPLEVAMQLSIHEMEGGIEPVVVQGGTGPEDGRDAIADRVDRLAARTAAWVRLRRHPNAEKKIAITLFAFPPGKGSVGTAAYLDVFRSAHAILLRLAAEGYNVEVPTSGEELLQRVIDSGDPRAPIAAAGLAVAHRMTVGRYQHLVPEWRRARRLFGEPPGAIDTDGRHLMIYGVTLGNIFVGVQPSFGFEGDPMRLLFDPAATPHHGFLAYYAYVAHEFRADAVLHLGTHGALEFMPGKQAGLSSSCWPDILMGDVPNVYVYAVNNPAEGTIAKRRGGAVTIGHLTPPSEPAGLARELAALAELVRTYLDETRPDRRERLYPALSRLAQELHLDDPLHATMDERVLALGAQLREIEHRRIPVGLHTVGRTPSAAEEIEILVALAIHDEPDLTPRSLAALLLDAWGCDGVRTLDDFALGRSEASEPLHQAIAATRDIATAFHRQRRRGAMRELRNVAPKADASGLERFLVTWDAVLRGTSKSDELEPLVRALSGRFVEAGPGGDPARSPEVLPVGRNLHALDPARVPSAGAMVQAQHAVDQLLAQRRRDLGHWPRRVGLVLWGLDNVKTQGEGVAQALLLLGVRPRRNSIGRVTDIEVVSLEELGRPRIDVTISASGIFRDIFGSHLALIDRAVRLVASLDEPEDGNFVRAAAHALMSEGLTNEDATTRVFSNAPGTYGAHVDQMVMTSSWADRSDLARIYARRKGVAFQSDGGVREVPEVFGSVVAGIDTTFQNIDSAEVSITDVDHYFEYLGGLTALIEQRSGRRPDAILADSTGATLRLRSLSDTVRLESRAKLLNPKWFEGLLAHGFEGAEEIRKRLDYTFGWSATADVVDSWIYDDVHRTFMSEDDVRERLLAANPHAFQAMVSRLLEAAARGFWSASDEQRDQLHRLSDRLEDLAEGVTEARAPS